MLTYLNWQIRYPINISGEVRTTIEKRIETDSNDDLQSIFDGAYTQVYHLLKSDSFPRFKKTLSPPSNGDVEQELAVSV